MRGRKVLVDLIRALCDERPRTMPELAAELGVDVARARRAFEYCEHVGYLERIGVGCEAGCPRACASLRCAYSAQQTPDGGAGTSCGAAWWRVTESGARVADPASRLAGASRCGSPSALWGLRSHRPLAGFRSHSHLAMTHGDDQRAGRSSGEL